MPEVIGDTATDDAMEDETLVAMPAETDETVLDVASDVVSTAGTLCEADAAGTPWTDEELPALPEAEATGVLDGPARPCEIYPGTKFVVEVADGEVTSPELATDVALTVDSGELVMVELSTVVTVEVVEYVLVRVTEPEV